MNLNHFVCAILQMALLSSDFRSIGFFVKSTAILGRQVVLQIFHLKCCENHKKLNQQLVNGLVFQACAAPFTNLFPVLEVARMPRVLCVTGAELLQGVWNLDLE